MPFIYSIIKSYKLNKISRIISKDMGNFNIDDMLDSSKTRKKEKPKEDKLKRAKVIMLLFHHYNH